MAAALAMLLLPADPKVEPHPFKPDVGIEDVEYRSPVIPTNPVWHAEPTQPPTAHEPDPLVCRTEAPFPNTDDCVMPPEPSEETDEPSVTPGQVLREVRRIGLPRLTVTVQPPGSTLVNLETIFHTTVRPFERTVTVLGSSVTVRAEPLAFTWQHGDGTTQSTSRPGRPYPEMDVIHRYRATGQVRPSVDVTYDVSYRIDGGEWQDLGTDITATGPATDLRIREARPVLIR